MPDVTSLASCDCCRRGYPPAELRGYTMECLEWLLLCAGCREGMVRELVEHSSRGFVEFIMKYVQTAREAK